MPVMLVSGRGGSGKSTLVALLARRLQGKGKVLVVDADESNLGLGRMLGLGEPAKTLMDYLGGKPAVREKLMVAIRSQGSEVPTLFAERFSLRNLPPECVSRENSLAWVRVGKIEHSMEGCACPMGAVARAFLNHLVVEKDEWVLVDTEAGLEHFGRGVLEGADAVLVVIDPSHEAVILAEKAMRLAQEAGKSLKLVLNKVDEQTAPALREMLAERNLEVTCVLPYSSAIARANLRGDSLEVGALGEELDKLISNLR